MQPTSGSGGSALPAGKKTRHGSHSQRARSISELVDGGLLTRAAGAHLRDAALSGHAGVQQALDDLEATGSAAAVLRASGAAALRHPAFLLTRIYSLCAQAWPPQAQAPPAGAS